jgi:hypothetical protein
MPIEISRSLVEHVLLGPTDDRRQLQDSPILGDVWIAFARAADEPLDLLITPVRAQTAGAVAIAISKGLGGRPDDVASIAYLQGIVAARLDFADVLRVIVPMTEWWHSGRNQKELARYTNPGSGPERLRRVIGNIAEVARRWDPADPSRQPGPGAERLVAVDRYVALAALILWAREERLRRRPRDGSAAGPDTSLGEALRDVSPDDVADPLVRLFGAIEREGQTEALVWQISLNRTATPAVLRSVPAVKADAARTLFAVRCQDIAWAVIDSGIDARHPAFRDASGASRVRRTLDFSHFRQIVTLSNANPAVRKRNAEKIASSRRTPPPDADEILADLAEDARKGRPVNWELVEKMVVVGPDEPPLSDHGTHVAGIIAASRLGAETVAGRPEDEWADGMCPDIRLYDFRVLAPNLRDTEFAVIAALQYIQYLNERNLHITIHGANLSLSIPHDVRNYACGRTPVCLACERLVDSGVVVVAAAGNRGYHTFETKEGSYEGYAAFSVTDPGNADGVITVGATHRYSPHTYGVSFFSSRGPTGDGRPKPDLVAPGERIHAPLPESEWGDHDGTSMAAPHVSGAAAMLMARYSELIGQPRRIKRILCESATDLGRERTFQGHGMLDVLRAFQNI